MFTQPTEIKAMDWNTIADHVKNGYCIARVYHDSRPFGKRLLEVNNVYLDAVDHVGISHPSGMFTAPLDTILSIQWLIPSEPLSELAALREQVANLELELAAARTAMLATLTHIEGMWQDDEKTGVKNSYGTVDSLKYIERRLKGQLKHDYP